MRYKFIVRDEEHPTVSSVDVSQSFDRCPVGYDGYYPTMTPRQHLIDLQLKRPLTGLEALYVQGFPDIDKAKLKDFSDTFLQEQPIISVFV